MKFQAVIRRTRCAVETTIGRSFKDGMEMQTFAARPDHSEPHEIDPLAAMAEKLTGLGLFPVLFRKEPAKLFAEKRQIVLPVIFKGQDDVFSQDRPVFGCQTATGIHLHLVREVGNLCPMAVRENAGREFAGNGATPALGIFVVSDRAISVASMRSGLDDIIEQSGRSLCVGEQRKESVARLGADILVPHGLNIGLHLNDHAAS